MHHHNTPSGSSAESPGFTVSHALTGLAVAGAITAAAVVLAPHVLPLAGIGGEEIFEDAMWRSHGYVAGASLPIGEAGSGIAGIINRGIANYIPLIGEKLAEGGWFNALTSASIGAVGFLAGRTLERRHGGHGPNWGTAIKIGSLITSALVALPVLLSGITMGLTYLSMLTSNNEFIDNTVKLLNHTIGVSGGKMHSAFLGLSGAAAGVAHLFTCGVSVLPLGLSVLMLRKRKVIAPGDIDCEIQVPAGIKPGEPCDATITLRDKKTGRLVDEDAIAVTHTKKLHLFVVDSSLRDYQHIHPEPTAEPGVFSFRFEPKTGNRYDAWADFTLAANGKNHIVKAAIPVKGRAMDPHIRVNEQASLGNLHFDWRASGPLELGADCFVDITVTDAQGRAVSDLEPVMGAFAHLAGFSADGKSLIHCHPLGQEPATNNERGGPKLRFHIHPETSGPVQFYLQVKHHGQEMFVPFGQQVKSPSRQSMPHIASACHAVAR